MAQPPQGQGNAATKEATASEPEMEKAAAPATEPDHAGRGRLLRGSALHLMLFGATVIIGAAAAPVPLPRLFFALLVWLVGCLSLYMPLA
ncbi:hypothetical protein GQ55_1G406700 [Panicum hallii var. hallii]|uniref:Uncharacterized protein n=1 Tax=Panicum hallii var. hallii TaxID=1504633 RepID=A0A2T7FCQ4_9POAL|nr:hypothetical protein GQ55_1G406700 [Panicum hallii var. hallii]